MKDFNERSSRDDEVEIVDLDLPGSALSLFLFYLGKKWPVVATSKIKLVVFILSVSLLVTILQTDSPSVDYQQGLTVKGSSAHLDGNRKSW